MFRFKVVVTVVLLFTAFSWGGDLWAGESVGNWDVTTSVSAIDDSINVTLTLEAETKTDLNGRGFRPELIIRCHEGRKDAYIWGDQPHATDAKYKDIVVRYGSKRAKRMRFQYSTNGASFFFRNWSDVKKLRKYDQFTIRYSKHLSGTVDIVFDLSGIKRALNTLNRSCS